MRTWTGDGDVDGVIYADLAFSKSGGESDGYTNYGWDAVTNLNSYEFTGDKYDGDFGTNYVISASSSSGNDRFYVMSLVTIGTYTNWYENLSSDYYDYWTVDGSDNNFGAGKEDTENWFIPWASGSGRRWREYRHVVWCSHLL